MGHHGTQTTEVGTIARQLFYRFLELDSFPYRENLTGTDFQEYLDDRAWAIDFSPLLHKYINVPLEHRTPGYQLRDLPVLQHKEPWTLQELREELADAVKDKEWYYTT